MGGTPDRDAQGPASGTGMRAFFIRARVSHRYESCVSSVPGLPFHLGCERSEQHETEQRGDPNKREYKPGAGREATAAGRREFGDQSDHDQQGRHHNPSDASCKEQIRPVHRRGWLKVATDVQRGELINELLWERQPTLRAAALLRAHQRIPTAGTHRKKSQRHERTAERGRKQKERDTRGDGHGERSQGRNRKAARGSRC